MKTNSLPATIKKACIKFNLISDIEKLVSKKITDGVSSDIWFVKTKNVKFCVKRALPKLSVKTNWFAPVSRSNYEAYYFKTCKQIIPESFPKVLGHDKTNYILAMQWFPSSDYQLWKKKLLANITLEEDALRVSKVLGKVHYSFLNDKKIEKTFLNDKTFHDIRIEPYLLFTSKSYPSFQKSFLSMAEKLKTNKKTLIHGDYSPKNILIGKDYPVILDAETACWGDPIFDLAFCLNHIVLKSILHRNKKNNHIKVFDCFVRNYFKYFKVDNKKRVIKNFLKLLAMLLLARIDGKSPVEYFNIKKKNIVRDFGKSLLESHSDELSKMKIIWNNFLE